jgi:hypothetical protein
VETTWVECLRCGEQRASRPGPLRCHEAGECPRCGYVGWADAAELSERARRLFRDLPLERRLKLRTVA